MGVALQVIVLPAFDRPYEKNHQEQADDYHSGNQEPYYFHNELPSRESTAPLDFVCPDLVPNTVFMRIALPTTSNELMGIAMAAINGVIIAAIARGTMIAL